jgi:hypothetical protein
MQCGLIMDLLYTANGRLWHLAKQGAFMCFLVACALLGASLVLTDWDDRAATSRPGALSTTTVPGTVR